MGSIKSIQLGNWPLHWGYWRCNQFGAPIYSNAWFWL